MIRMRKLGSFFVVLSLWTSACVCGKTSPPSPNVGDHTSRDVGHDVRDRIVAGTAHPASDFPTVGIVTDAAGAYLCTGTLIDSRHVLTAGHCAVQSGGAALSGADGRFLLNGTVYASTQVFLHPTFDLNLVGSIGIVDAAIFELAADVPGVQPSPISRQAPSIGEAITIVGYGLTGKTSITQKLPPPGTINSGTNSIADVTATQFVWEFKRGFSAIAPGDSGGPTFSNINGVLTVVGVHSQLLSPGNVKPGHFGTINQDSRVDVMAPWIDSVLNPGSTSNTPPQISTAASAQPNPALAGQVVQFSVDATDNSGLPLLYIWNFGDGESDTSSTPVHVYPFAGAYTATVSVTNGISASQSSVQVLVNAVSNGELVFKTFQLQIQFSALGLSQCKISGSIQPPLTRLPQFAVIDIGGATQAFFFSSSSGGGGGGGGGGGRAANTFSYDPSNGKFSVALKSDFSDPWREVGIVDQTISTVVNMPVRLSLDGNIFTATQALKYTSHAGRSGRAIKQ